MQELRPCAIPALGREEGGFCIINSKSTTHRSPQKLASFGSAATPEVQAQPFKEAGAAGSFFGYFLLTAKR